MCVFILLLQTRTWWKRWEIKSEECREILKPRGREKRCGGWRRHFMKIAQSASSWPEAHVIFSFFFFLLVDPSNLSHYQWSLFHSKYEAHHVPSMWIPFPESYKKAFTSFNSFESIAFLFDLWLGYGNSWVIFFIQWSSLDSVLRIVQTNTKLRKKNCLVND